MTEPAPEPTPEPQPEPTPDEEEEAEEAEPAAPEPGEPTEPEAPEGEPPAEEPPASPQGEEASPPPVSEKEIEEGTQKLQKEATRHANRVSEIMGEAAQDLLRCELCVPIIPGFRWDRPVDEIVRERVRAAIGLSDLSGFEPAKDARRCDDCKGKGRVLSGSLVEKYATVKCLTCNERGYVEVGTRPVAVPVAPQNGLGESPREQLEERSPDTDPWGRAPTDPDYGVLPGFVRA